MDSEVNVYRSLPPLVEGKLHGYLKFHVDEVLWSRRSPGNVTILASWWGELDSAQFRLIDVQTGSSRLDRKTIETYAIRTSIDLFVEYLKNCETIELVVISEETHQVLGIAHVVDLLDIFEGKNYSRYFPIFNESGNRLGDVHIGLRFTNMSKSSKSIRKMKDFQKTKFENQLSYPVIDIKPKYTDKKLNRPDKIIFDNKSNNISMTNNSEHNEYIYESVLKDKGMQDGIPLKKFNTEVADKLVAQVVARAQRLRGAILKETYDDDPLALSETSVFDSSRSDTSADNEAKLYEYFLGKKMSRFDERRALETLRSTSPTPSLIELASETIQSCQQHCKQHSNQAKTIVSKPEEILDDVTLKDSAATKIRESSLLDRVDSMKIIVESLTLSPAGYRRAQSSCVLRRDSVPLAMTYSVEYNTLFTYNKKSMKKFNESRPTKLWSKKQVGQVVYFNHQAVFDLPKSCIHMDIPLKFKVYNRHLNQRTPILLGFGSIYIAEVAEMDTFSTTQKLAIINKGIKVGELKVNIELGCDGIHFGKEFVDAVTSTKQNIPVYDVSPIPSTTESKAKSATGSHSKPNSRVSTSSKYSYSCSGTKSSESNKNIVTEQKESNTEDRYVKMDQSNDNNEEKVLLHGLIYIAEGKGLPKLNTYLICRAFWKEDRATSQLCTNTENPLYQFHELVPLLHGQDLLDRTKDNFIVTEVWNKNVTGQDSLLGFAKLPLHQLYIAYRDPLVVPHLLLSKYPVISVDGWVPICEPVTGRSCGELLALVALGTADQIALLEITRGLRDCNITPRAIQSSLRNAYENIDKSDVIPAERQDVNQRLRSCSDFPQNSSIFLQEVDRRGIQHFQISGNVSASHNVKTQESQTEITTVRDIKTSDISNRQPQNEVGSQSLVLHSLVDHLAQTLNVSKSDGNPVAETQTIQSENGKISDLEQNYLDPMSNDSVSSSEDSPRENYDMPTEMYRSVGVGAEFDDTVFQIPSTSCQSSNLKSLIKEKLPSSDELRNTPRHIGDEPSFRVHVEIECALHLPKVEKPEGSIEPSTYVTFQSMQNDNGTQFGPYKVTNIFLNSCSPKWEWRCDTRLSSDLLVNDQKRMILKIWRLADPTVNSDFNLDKDIVIGFAAVDLSILLAGFPLVSGWFHIMDFTGKCNGQIKVTITPLENITIFVKSTANTSIPRKQTSHLTTTRYIPQSTNISPQMFVSHTEQPPLSHSVTNTDGFCHSYTQLDNDATSDIGLSLGDVSMTFLSQSLKQKLTELDEITKRLKSRLHDVTNEDFDVDFDPDFDANEPELELERQNGNIVNELSGNSARQNIEDWQPLPSATNNSSCQSSQINQRYRNSNFFNDIQNQYAPHRFDNANTENAEANLTDTGYSTNSHVQSSQNLSNGHLENDSQNGHFFNNDHSPEEVPEQPVRGAKMHINHLLDKLTSLTSTPPLAENFPIQRNLHDFIASLRHNKVHVGSGKCNQEINVRNVPTQTDSQDIQCSEMPKNQTLLPINLQLNAATKDVNENNSIDHTVIDNLTQARNKVSTLIREELVTEENNDTTEFDDLTTHLLTSNVRHMDLHSIFNPLIYPHLIPDVRVSDSLSNPNTPMQDLDNFNTTRDGVVIEKLDNRYAETFNATINSGLGGLRNLIEIDTSLTGNSVSQNRLQTNLAKSLEGNDLFRMTPTGVSDDIDRNIDVSVADKPSNDDLMASNSTESTTTLSFNTFSIRQRQEVVDNFSSMSSDSSVSLTRQAPDGGNPTEETNKPLVMRNQNDSENSSTDT